MILRCGCGESACPNALSILIGNRLTQVAIMCDDDILATTHYDAKELEIIIQELTRARNRLLEQEREG